jgi:signal transduction histidine kinase
VLLPTMLVVGILVTHRIAGPVYRFEQYLGALARGENPGPCHIRRGDELQELCQQINAAFETLRARAGRADTSSEEQRPAA